MGRRSKSWKALYDDLTELQAVANATGKSCFLVRPNDDRAKKNRLDKANELLRIIATCGQKFFAHKGRVSRFEFDQRGRVWFVDSYNEARIYTHYTQGRWRGFSQGGTLRDVVIRLRDFITKDQPAGATFGPWPEWYSQGDPWGYGADMRQVYDAAVRLEIVRPAAPLVMDEYTCTECQHHGQFARGLRQIHCDGCGRTIFLVPVPKSERGD